MHLVPMTNTRLAPNEAVLPYALGALYSQIGRLRDGVAAFRGVLAANPEMADVHNNLGTALLRLGDVAGAEAAIREAIRLRPELAVTHFNLGLKRLKADLRRRSRASRRRYDRSQHWLKQI
jgi:tetratricopeptide (TPR) repeat protein